MSREAVKRLHSLIESEKLQDSGGFAIGTVIKWDWNGYNYAALLANNNLWYITGTSNYYSHNGVSFKTLVKALSESNVNKVFVNDGWYGVGI